MTTHTQVLIDGEWVDLHEVREFTPTDDGGTPAEVLESFEYGTRFRMTMTMEPNPAASRALHRALHIPPPVPGWLRAAAERPLRRP